MRRHLLATAAISAVGLTTATGLAAAEDGTGPAARDSARTAADCIGLTCVAPGSRHDVPQARRPVPRLAGPNQLAGQTTAGFYEFGRGTTVGKRAVAYVVPYGQSQRMPASVRDLPVVRAIERSAGPTDFDLGTVVIFEPGISLFTPRRKRNLAQSSAVDQYDCNDNYFCLYGCRDGGFKYPWYAGGHICPHVQFGPLYTGKGWRRLGDFGFNDRTTAMRNRRDRDSLLAKDWVCGRTCTGSGTRYCGDSHSSDTSLFNNAIGGATASAVANVPDDIHC